MMARSTFTLSLFILSLSFTVRAQAQFSTGINTQVPDKKAALDVVALTGSAAQGVLVPRLSTADSLNLITGTKPTEGLLYYDLNVHQFRYYNGTRWTCMVASPYSNALATWNLNGNTVADGAFIGTMNAKPLVLKTNNKEALTIASDGNVTVGSGNITSTAQLNVRGSLNVEKAITRTATGLANLVPIAYATTDGTGTLDNTANTANFTRINRIGDGVYVYAIEGERISTETHVVVATLINTGFGLGAGEISWSIIDRSVVINTYNSLGVAADKTFSFVVYRK